MRLLRPREYSDAIGKSLPVVYKSIAAGTLLSLRKSGERASVIADHEVEIQVKAILADLNTSQRRELVQLLEDARSKVIEVPEIRDRCIRFIRDCAEKNSDAARGEAA